MNWWAVLRPVTLKREGKLAVERVDTRLKGKADEAIFSDSEAMRLLDATARACMDLIGLAARDEYSFAAVWKSITRMASSIENLPKTCDPRDGLRKRLQEAGKHIMRCPQDRFEAMLATPATAVRRITAFAVDERRWTHSTLSTATSRA